MPSRPFRGTVLVVDATVLVVALADDGTDGEAARTRLRHETLAAPELIDLEVASVLRRQDRAGLLGTRRANLALTDLAALPMQRAPHGPLLPRCWDLRHNLTTYDAAYVALADALDAPLATCDAKLAAAAGRRVNVEVF